MAWRIGIDEAGLGPNLGPFVVSAVVWETPDDACDSDLWAVFPELLTNDPRDPRGRLAVADSKALFQPQRGMIDLERSVLSLLGGWGTVPVALCELHDRLHALAIAAGYEPWVTQESHLLPREADGAEIGRFAMQLSCAAPQAGWRLHAAVSAVVTPRAFNAALNTTGNKAAVTSGVHAEVLRRAYEHTGDGAVIVFSDKHGGRNRYGTVLAEVFPGEWIDVLSEGADCSRYRVGRATVSFEPRAEHHAVVAMASMVSKYLRELHMAAFNGYWRRLLPDIKPTQGYPVDAKRFYARIESHLPVCGLTKDDIWRYK